MIILFKILFTFAAFTLLALVVWLLSFVLQRFFDGYTKSLSSKHFLEIYNEGNFDGRFEFLLQDRTGDLEFFVTDEQQALPVERATAIPQPRLVAASSAIGQDSLQTGGAASSAGRGKPKSKKEKKGGVGGAANQAGAGAKVLSAIGGLFIGIGSILPGAAGMPFTRLGNRIRGGGKSIKKATMAPKKAMAKTNKLSQQASRVQKSADKAGVPTSGGGIGADNAAGEYVGADEDFAEYNDEDFDDDAVFIGENGEIIEYQTWYLTGMIPAGCSRSVTVNILADQPFEETQYHIDVVTQLSEQDRFAYPRFSFQPELDTIQVYLRAASRLRQLWANIVAAVMILGVISAAVVLVWRVALIWSI